MTAGRPGFPAVLACCLVLSAGLFAASVRFDNKYALRGGHPAANGVMRLDMAAYNSRPLLYLIDGWELYRYRLLSPEDFARGAPLPDGFVFIGQYGGLEMGDPSADPHGSATYRLNVFADDIPRDFALEIPEIYSSCRIWINGELKYERGEVDPTGYRAETGGSFIAFTAADRVEIIVQATDYTGYYSGMVYPPAFGSPGTVHRLLSLRLLIHGAACAVALFIGLFCLLLGFRRPYTKGAWALSLLCWCFIGISCYPVADIFGIYGGVFPTIERVCHYGLFFAAVMLGGILCGVPGRVWRPAAAVGAAICIAVAAFPVSGTSAAALHAFSVLLGLYKWAAAAYLTAAAVWAARRGNPGSRPLLIACCVFGGALAADRVEPLFEPMLFGWHIETAGFVFLIVVAGILLRDTLRVHRESLALREKNAADSAMLEAHLVRSRLEREHVDRTRKMMHETRNQYALMRVYLQKMDIDKLEGHLDGLLAEGAEAVLQTFCENELVNAILTAKLEKARAEGIRVETEIGGVPARLDAEDGDIAGLLMNLLDNSIEACMRLNPKEDRWIALSLRFGAGVLAVHCRNSSAGTAASVSGRPLSAKPDRESHGFGLRVVEDIAKKYDGAFSVEWDEKSFSAAASLNIAGR